MNRKKLIHLIILIAITITACAAPTATPEPTSGPDLALTITAQAQLLQGLSQTASVPTLTPEPTFTSAPALTETPSKVFVTVSANTNCRSGPGADYEIVGALTIGQQAEVVGKSSNTNYWVIDNPNAAGTCWLWGEYATISGDTASLQEFEIPPTVTPLAALAPVIERVVVRFDSSSGGLIAYLDVYYIDGEGDANFADFQLISTSVITSGTIKDVSFAPNANQRRGSTVTGQWSCGTKQYDVTVGVTIRDLAGHTSNTIGVTFSCNKN